VDQVSEIKSVKLNAGKAAARAKREQRTASFTAEQRAKTILRDRAAQRAQASQRANFS
jgi:hypothetical protein